MQGSSNASFRDLRVWQSSIDLVEEIYKLSRSFPQPEIYALTQQMRRSAVSVPSNIAEGHGRTTPKEFAMFLRNANGSLRELETQLIISQRLGYSAPEDCDRIQRHIGEIAKMLTGLMRYQQSR